LNQTLTAQKSAKGRRSLDALADLLATNRGFALALTGLFMVIVPIMVHFYFVIHTLTVDRDRLSAYIQLDGAALLADLRHLEGETFLGADPTSDGTIAALDDLRRHLGTLEAANVSHEYDEAKIKLDMRLASEAASNVRAKLTGLIALVERAPSGQPLDETRVAEVMLGINAAREALETMLNRIAQVEDDLVNHLLATVLTMAVAYMILVVSSASAGLVALLLLRKEVHVRQERTRAEERVEYLAYHDWMTGVANEIQFRDRLSAVLSDNVAASVVVVDLDGFGEINDRRGQAFGDAIIKELARRSATSAEALGGFAARLGGDRFGLYVPIDTRADVAVFCEHLLARCREPVAKGAQTVEPSVSAGVVVLSNLGEARAYGFETIMRVANFALYAAKEQPESAYVVYDESLEEKFVDHVAIAEALPDAILNGNVEVALQPKVEMRTGRIGGFHAMAHWKLNGSVVQPQDIAIAAEEAGLSRDFDRYMLDRAIGVVADWNRRRKTDFPICVNLSACNFHSLEGAERVAACLAEHRFRADLVTIEISETAENDAKNQPAIDLSGLRALGCRVAIGGFGSGNTSLADLRRLSADEIKVDRSLLFELETSTEARFILDAVLHLARKLEIDVVIDGVDNQAHADILTDLGAVWAQGFHFGSPRQAVDWLADVTYGRPESISAA